MRIIYRMRGKNHMVTDESLSQMVRCSLSAAGIGGLCNIERRPSISDSGWLGNNYHMRANELTQLKTHKP